MAAPPPETCSGCVIHSGWSMLRRIVIRIVIGSQVHAVCARFVWSHSQQAPMGTFHSRLAYCVGRIIQSIWCELIARHWLLIAVTNAITWEWLHLGAVSVPLGGIVHCPAWRDICICLVDFITYRSILMLGWLWWTLRIYIFSFPHRWNLYVLGFPRDWKLGTQTITRSPF